MKISIVVAHSLNYVIGIRNELPWHLPADLKQFKAITSGGTILMGRKTFESIGKPLPNRTNLILSTQPTEKEGCVFVSNVNEAISKCTGKELFVIGGEKVYKNLLTSAQKMYITIVETTISGDAFFPRYDLNDWIVIKKEKHIADDKHKYNYTFLELERR